MTEALLKDAPQRPSAALDADAILETIGIDWQALISLLVPELLAEGKIGVEEMITGLGLGDAVSWDDVAPDVQRYADDRAAELIGMSRTSEGRLVPSSKPGLAITETTRDMLRSTVRQAIAEGWTANEIQHKVMEDHAFSPARALNIARTETAFARNQGALIAAKTSGVIRAKAWDLDSNPCELCIEAAAEGEIPLHQDFSVGVAGPPLHPSCGCGLRFVPEDDGQ
jgi:Phage Mu protein F like protein